MFQTLVWKTCEGNDFLSTNFSPDLSYGFTRQNPKKNSKSVRPLLLFFDHKIKKVAISNRCTEWPKWRIGPKLSTNNNIICFYHNLKENLKPAKPFLRNYWKFKFFRKWGLVSAVTDGLTPKLQYTKKTTSSTITRKNLWNPS